MIGMTGNQVQPSIIKRNKMQAGQKQNQTQPAFNGKFEVLGKVVKNNKRKKQLKELQTFVENFLPRDNVVKVVRETDNGLTLTHSRGGNTSKYKMPGGTKNKLSTLFNEFKSDVEKSSGPSVSATPWATGHIPLNRPTAGAAVGPSHMSTVTVVGQQQGGYVTRTVDQTPVVLNPHGRRSGTSPSGLKETPAPQSAFVTGPSTVVGQQPGGHHVTYQPPVVLNPQGRRSGTPPSGLKETPAPQVVGQQQSPAEGSGNQRKKKGVIKSILDIAGDLAVGLAGGGGAGM